MTDETRWKIRRLSDIERNGVRKRVSQSPDSQFAYVQQWYCQSSECIAREVEVKIKPENPDVDPAPSVARCPMCGVPMKWHGFVEFDEVECPPARQPVAHEVPGFHIDSGGGVALWTVEYGSWAAIQPGDFQLFDQRRVVGQGAIPCKWSDIKPDDFRALPPEETSTT